MTHWLCWTNEEKGKAISAGILERSGLIPHAVSCSSVTAGQFRTSRRSWRWRPGWDCLEKHSLSGDYRLFHQWEKDTELRAHVWLRGTTRQTRTSISLFNMSVGICHTKSNNSSTDTMLKMHFSFLWKLQWGGCETKRKKGKFTLFSMIMVPSPHTVWIKSSLVSQFPYESWLNISPKDTSVNSCQW